MNWNGKKVIDISRKFLDSAGAQRQMRAKANMNKVTHFETLSPEIEELISQKKYKEAILAQLSKLENASQR